MCRLSAIALVLMCRQSVIAMSALIVGVAILSGQTFFARPSAYALASAMERSKLDGCRLPCAD